MKTYSKDDYYYLLHNGCYPDGYVEGIGFVSSRTVITKSPVPSYPNHKAYGITRDTTFFQPIQVPVIKPLFVPESKPSDRLCKEMDELVEKITKENITMPAFTLEAKEMVAKLKEEIKKKKTKNDAEIAKLEAKRNDTQDSQKKQKFEKRIKEWQDANRDLEEVEEEIKVLAVSNQTYDLKTRSSLPENVHAKADYNSATKNVELHFSGRKPILHEFAHELKHAYQFERGTLSFVALKDGYGLYDKEDEREAFKRGQLFGSGESFGRNESIYDNLPDSRIYGPNPIIESDGKHSYPTKGGIKRTVIVLPSRIRELEQILQSSHTSDEEKQKAENDLQELSNGSGTVFHANGRTYAPDRWDRMRKSR